MINLFEVEKQDLLKFHCLRDSKEKFYDLDWERGQKAAELHLQLSALRRDYVFEQEFWIDNYTIGLSTAGMSITMARQIAEEVITNGRKKKRNYSLFKDCVSTLVGLKKSGYRLAVVSNWHGNLETVLKELNIFHYFDCIADSHLVGHEKPDRRLFDFTLEQMNLGPNEVVHVGDLYYTDIVGAQEAGIDTVLLDHLGILSDVFKCKCITRISDLLDFY